MASQTPELSSATNEEAQAIQAINRDTVHKICSGQVVVTLAIAVKELVENAIDAGATTVEVRLKEYGSELVEVVDNGCGVKDINFEALTLKHYTSKIRQFADLSFVLTLGFRGEALSSLCALSDLCVITRHKSTDIGTKIEYDHNGHIKNKTLCARQIGTTVSLANLFKTLPVRHKDFHKNLKREFARMLELLYAYCIISNVRILCSNQTKKSPRSLCVNTHGSKSLLDNIISVFGVKQSDTLIQIKLHRPENEILEEYKLSLVPGDEIPFNFEGYISKCMHGCGRSSSDRQFYYINGRPCDPTKIAKIVNQVYRSFNGNQYPFVALDIKTEQSQIDVNVTPDKRQIFLENEKLLLATIKMSLLEMFKEFPSMFKMQNTKLKFSSSQPSTSTPGSGLFKRFSQNDSILSQSCGVKRKQDVCEKKAKGILAFIYEKRMKIDEDKSENLSEISESDNEEKQIMKFVEESYNSDDSDIDPELKKEKLLNKSNLLYDNFRIIPDSQESNVDDIKNSEDDVLFQALNDLNRSNCSNKIKTEKTYRSEINKTPKKSCFNITIEESPSCSLKKPNTSNYEFIIDTTDTQLLHNENKVEIEFDTPKSQTVTIETKNVINTSITEIKNKIMSNLQKSKTEKNVVKFRSELTSKNAENELQKQISKDMFAKMKILGQFNKGFIITKLDSDLFIIDQHASDEKYNFETLQQTTVIQNQKLVIPKPLELTAANENLLIDNMEVFTRNGFCFNIDENAELRKRVSLTAIPMSKNYQFGKEDIDELLFMLQEDSLNSSYRPSRVRAMFASRACRKSVMIGSDLSMADMKKIVSHMGQIEQPWNCPHGRPTMRHLINLNLIPD